MWAKVRRAGFVAQAGYPLFVGLIAPIGVGLVLTIVGTLVAAAT